MRKKRAPHSATQSHANPWNWMRIVEVQAENKIAWQRHDTHQSERRSYSHSGDGPEVSEYFRDTTIPVAPRLPFRAVITLQSAQYWSNRFDQLEQCNSLVSDFMDQRRSDAAADHSFSWHSYDRHGVVTSPWQARACSSYSCAMTAIQKTDHAGQAVVVSSK